MPDDSGSPRYHRIADELRAQISAGDLAPGSQLPGELELQRRFGVSRNTIRLAIKRLIDEGLVVSSQGRGTFVRGQFEPFVWDWTTLEALGRHQTQAARAPGRDQWAIAVLATGREPREDVTVLIVTPPEQIAKRLGLDPVTGVAVLRRRVRYVDNEPYLLSDSYIPRDLAEGTPLMLPREVGAPGGVLAAAGHITVRFHDEMIVRMPTRAESDALHLPAGTPVFEHVRTGYDKDDRGLRVMVTILPGDRHVITYDVSAEC